MHTHRLRLAIQGICLIILLGISFCLKSHAQSKDHFFVRVITDRDTIYEGDSLLISVVLYASSPLAQVKAKGTCKTKGKHSLRARTNSQRAIQGQSRIGRQVYHTLIWKQYVMTPKMTGIHCFKSPAFQGVLQKCISMPDWTEQIMGVQPQYKQIEVKAQSEKVYVNVKEKPLRTTQEMMRDQIVF